MCVVVSVLLLLLLLFLLLWLRRWLRLRRRAGLRGIFAPLRLSAGDRDTMDALDRWVAGVSPSVISEKLARK